MRFKMRASNSESAVCAFDNFISNFRHDVLKHVKHFTGLPLRVYQGQVSEEKTICPTCADGKTTGP